MYFKYFIKEKCEKFEKEERKEEKSSLTNFEREEI